MAYMAVGTLCAFDKRGMDTYFAEYGEDMDLLTALRTSTRYPELTLRTDNWGYFQEAYNHVKNDEGSYWKPYNCFQLLLSTVYIAAPLWIAMSIMRLYGLKKGWANHNLYVTRA
eukprot:TRINITY_DN1133_c0_g2_i2.p2 TRINITY_DN1133_c0_g2~~TRINITY_DN1133_c0_g2_i2.p2  ORF type:complete len:114 (-),score=16.79 TRINITY_DN1133_c0_g2_i2:337-678(-)